MLFHKRPLLLPVDSRACSAVAQRAARQVWRAAGRQNQSLQPAAGAWAPVSCAAIRPAAEPASMLSPENLFVTCLLSLPTSAQAGDLASSERARRAPQCWCEALGSCRFVAGPLVCDRPCALRFSVTARPHRVHSTQAEPASAGAGGRSSLQEAGRLHKYDASTDDINANLYVKVKSG